MTANGAIYAIKPTFWIFYYVPGQGIKKRQLICLGLKEKYVGFQKGGTAGFKMTGAAPSFVGVAEKAPNLNDANMRLSAEVSATAEETKALEKLNQSGAKAN